MKTFEIKEDVLQAVGDYLIRRPYAEVVQLIAALQSLRELSAGAPAPADDTAGTDKIASGGKH